MARGLMYEDVKAHFLLLLLQSTQDPSRPPSQAGRVIPAGATVFGMAVQCLEIRRHHR